MTSTNAYISISGICNSWLLKKEKHPNSEWKVLLLAGECVQKLAYMSLPMVQHVLLTRPAGQTWFDLPEYFTAVVSMGIRWGDGWRPIGVSKTLMGMPAFAGNGQFNAAEFGNDLNIDGAQQSWFDDPAVAGPDFLAADFSAADFLAAATPVNTPNSNLFWDLYFSGMHARLDTVVINPAYGQILTGAAFPSDELYLVYMGVGTVDTMTRIPLYAQSAIEAFIDWKWLKNKRGGARGAQYEEGCWNKEHKILRTLVSPMSVTDIKHILTQQWHGRRFGTNGYGVNKNIVSAPTYITQKVGSFTFLNSILTTTITHPDILGRTVTGILLQGGTWLDPSMFSVVGDTITITSGAQVAANSQVTVFLGA